MYSLQDLLDVNNGSLLPYIQKIHDEFLAHIKGDGTPGSECTVRFEYSVARC